MTESYEVVPSALKIIYVSMALFLMALIFFIPVSSTGKSIGLSLVTPLILLIPECRQRLLIFLKDDWAIMALLFVGLACLGCIWSHALWTEKLLVLEKYGKFLYLPILAAGFLNARLRYLGLYTFIVAMSLTCTLSILKHFSMIHYNGDDPGQIFQNHIMTGLLMSFAAYLSAYLFMYLKSPSRYVVLCLSFVFSYQVLFIGTGRTGYVIYCLLMAMLAIQVLSRKQAICALLLGAFLIVGIFYSSPVMRLGILKAYDDVQNYHHTAHKDTSVGFRLQFHDFAYGLFKMHPLIGNGTAGFTANFRDKKPVPAWNRRLLEPHSQYWLIASEFGLVGVVLFASFMVSLLVSSLQLTAMRPVALGVLLTFFMGNFSDSLLFYSGTGYFFITLMALALSEKH